MSERSRVSYSVLFRVDVRHGFFLNRALQPFEYLPAAQRYEVLSTYDLRKILTITPTHETMDTLRRHRLLLRPDGGGFAVIAATSNGRMHVPLPDNSLMRFHLCARQSYFAEISNLHVLDAGRPFSLFSTDAKNIDAEGPHLSRPLAPFSSTRDYSPGDQIVDRATAPTRRLTALVNITRGSNRRTAEWAQTPELPPVLTAGLAANLSIGDRVLSDGIVYQALQNTPPADVSATDAWQQVLIPGLQAAGKADQIKLSGRFANIDLGTLDPDFIKVDVANAAGSILHTARLHSNQAQGLRLINVDLGDAGSGIRHITLRNSAGNLLTSGGQLVAASNQTVYLDPQAQRNNAFAAIEVHSHSPGYELVDANRQLRSPTFVLRITSRPTFWSYAFPRPLSSAEQTQLDTSFEMVPDAPDRIIAREARSLDRGFVRLQRLNTDKLLPNPTEQTGIAVDASTGRLISPIQLTHRV